MLPAAATPHLSFRSLSEIALPVYNLLTTNSDASLNQRRVSSGRERAVVESVVTFESVGNFRPVHSSISTRSVTTNPIPTRSTRSTRSVARASWLTMKVTRGRRSVRADSIPEWTSTRLTLRFFLFFAF